MENSFPEVIRIESSAICNFNCVHCANGNNHPARRSVAGILREEVFDSLMKQFQEVRYVPRVAVLYHGGEPLLNPRLCYYVQILKKSGVERIKINSNASLLDEKKRHELLQSGITDIDFSFDGDSPEENDAIRINGSFTRDAHNVIEFSKLISRMNVDINITIHNVRILTSLELEKWGGREV